MSKRGTMGAFSILFAAILFDGCSCTEDFVIVNKFVDVHNPHLAIFYYRLGCTIQSTRDSSHKYNVGDDLRKYKKP